MTELNRTISVIIPCYNVESYVAQCLDSIVNQTYRHIEIICVNDGSTDGTADLLEEYRQKDHRIRVITQANTGISAARNLGLENAVGDFITFVDSDDWLEIDAFEKALLGAVEDIVCFSYYRNFDKAEVSKDFGISGVFPADFIQRRIVGLLGSELKHISSFDALATCWGKIYRRACLQDIKFKDLKEFGTWEDGIFNLEILENASTVRIVNKPYYHYRKVSQATYTSSYKEGLHKKWLRKFEWIKDFLTRHHKSTEFFLALDNRIAVTLLNLAFNEMNADKSMREKRKVIGEILVHPRFRTAMRSFQFKYLPSIWKPFYYFAKNTNVYILTCMAALIYRLANRKSNK